jgi:hypothetical protein
VKNTHGFDGMDQGWGIQGAFMKLKPQWLFLLGFFCFLLSAHENLSLQAGNLPSECLIFKQNDTG